jgi:transposase
MTKKMTSPKVIDWDGSNIDTVKKYLINLRGNIILTIEETTTSQWLYVEFRDLVNRIIICDPYRNHLLAEGPKTDKIDAGKLCLLLKSGLLKEVYHCNDQLYEYRCLLSAYTDLVKAGVRIQNQRSALYRARGHCYKKQHADDFKRTLYDYPLREFVANWQDNVVERYIEDKAAFEEEITKLVKGNRFVNNLTTLPGIGVISSFKIYAIVIEPARFRNRGAYLSYCGLVKHEKYSGGRSYGKKKPRYNRILKSVYQTATRIAIMSGNKPINEYYEYLQQKGLSKKQIEIQIARYMARVSLAMMSNGQKYDPYRWRKDDVVAA